jgi:hypothetical protein
MAEAKIGAMFSTLGPHCTKNCCLDRVVGHRRKMFYNTNWEGYYNTCPRSAHGSALITTRDRRVGGILRSPKLDCRLPK